MHVALLIYSGGTRGGTKGGTMDGTRGGKSGDTSDGTSGDAINTNSLQVVPNSPRPYG